MGFTDPTSTSMCAFWPEYIALRAPRPPVRSSSMGCQHLDSKWPVNSSSCQELSHRTARIKALNLSHQTWRSHWCVRLNIKLFYQQSHRTGSSFLTLLTLWLRSYSYNTILNSLCKSSSLSFASMSNCGKVHNCQVKRNLRESVYVTD